MRNKARVECRRPPPTTTTKSATNSAPGVIYAFCIAQADHAAGRLSGLIAISAGSGVSKKSKGAIQGLTLAAGVDDGLIAARSNDKMLDAFGKAADIMSGVVGHA